MSAINEIRNDAKYFLTMAIVRGLYMPVTIYLSFAHIVALGHMTGLTGTQAFIAPFLVDGFAILGMVFRSFDDAGMRRFGLWMQATAGVVSLAANILSGRNLGERVFGALVVVAFVVAERAGEFMSQRHAVSLAARKAAEAVVQTAAEAAAKRSAAGKKAAATKARNAAAKTRQAREEARVLRRMMDAPSAV